MFKNDMMYFPEQYSIIYKVSYLMLFTVLYGIYKQKYDLTIIPAAIFLTSINHWKKPKNNSFRRKMDLIVTRVSLILVLIIGYKSEFYAYYYFLLILAASLYPLGSFLYSQKLYWCSVYTHALFHILSNIACIILFSGSLLFQ